MWSYSGEGRARLACGHLSCHIAYSLAFHPSVFQTLNSYLPLDDLLWCDHQVCRWSNIDVDHQMPPQGIDQPESGGRDNTYMPIYINVLLGPACMAVLCSVHTTGFALLSPIRMLYFLLLGVRCRVLACVWHLSIPNHVLAAPRETAPQKPDTDWRESLPHLYDPRGLSIPTPSEQLLELRRFVHYRNEQTKTGWQSPILSGAWCNLSRPLFPFSYTSDPSPPIMLY